MRYLIRVHATFKTPPGCSLPYMVERNVRHPKLGWAATIGIFDYTYIMEVESGYDLPSGPFTILGQLGE